MKKTHTILILLLGALLLIPATGLAKGKNDGEGRIKFTNTSHNFGTIREEKGSVTTTFEFINEGNGNLVIIDATAQCGCTRPTYPKQPIAPGKKGKISVTFNPARRPGSFNKNITVRTNGKPKKVTLKIHGNVLPKDR